MEGIHLRFEITLEQFLEDLTQAVYKIALEYRAGGTFIELQLELWNALREIVRKDMLVSKQCGSRKVWMGTCLPKE